MCLFQRANLTNLDLEHPFLIYVQRKKVIFLVTIVLFEMIVRWIIEVLYLISAEAI